MPNLTETFFVVEGRGEFPVDMLRYDTCYPCCADDSAKLERQQDDLRRVTLVHRGIVKCGKLPTVERWRSFGWNVLHYGTDHGEAMDLMRAPVGSSQPIML